MFNSLLLSALFSLSSLGPNLVLQTAPELVEKLNWGVYYDDTTLTCSVASEQNNFAMFLHHDLETGKDDLSFGNSKWKFTYKQTKDLTTFVTYADGTIISTTLPYTFKANSSYISIESINTKFIGDLPKQFSVQFNAKYRLTFDVSGLVALQKEYKDCIEQMREINEEIIADTEEAEGYNK